MKYPGGIKKTNLSHNISYKNRGMDLENDLNLSNEYYKEINKAFIYKKPTPIKIVHVDYVSRNCARIDEAYFKEPSTTDYNGIYKGKYIDFEAKETKNKTSFSLNNIHPHQIKHLRNVIEHGGIAFLIIRFSTLNQNYFVLAEDFLNYIDTKQRKSIPIVFFENKGYKLKNKLKPRIDYLAIIDELYGGKL